MSPQPTGVKIGGGSRQQKKDDKNLHLAVNAQRHDDAEKLLMKKADPNSKNSDDMTPLMIAASQHDTLMVSILLRGKADATLEGVGGSTALHEVRAMVRARCTSCHRTAPTAAATTLDPDLVAGCSVCHVRTNVLRAH
jgi:predicted CXXCH cytochrome family protein